MGLITFSVGLADGDPGDCGALEPGVEGVWVSVGVSLISLPQPTAVPAIIATRLAAAATVRTLVLVSRMFSPAPAPAVAAPHLKYAA